MTITLFAVVLILALATYVASARRAAGIAGDRPGTLHSRPSYHGMLSLLWVLIAGWGVLAVTVVAADWGIDQLLAARIRAALPDASGLDRHLVLSDAYALARGGLASASDDLRLALAASSARLTTLAGWATLVLTLSAALFASGRTFAMVSLTARARNRSEALIELLLLVMAAIAVLTTLGIVLSLIFETVRFFGAIDWRIDRFLFGTNWSPLSGVFEGKLDSEKVGAFPLFAGTLLITLIAMVVAVPIGLFAAIFLSDFASPTVRAIGKPTLEVLAGIPTVVYGFFAAITLAPLIRGWGEGLGLDVASESALAAGIVMGIMIIPFISSLSDDVINAVPQSLRDGSLGLGATRAETIRQVVLPAALPGIVSAVLLGISRAIGETMIVVMAAGQGANLTANPLEAVTTVTVQIVALITGDTEASTAAGPAFTLGFTLFVMTLLMNVLAQRLVRKYRERYD